MAMRQTLYVLVNDNGLRDQIVGGVTDDPAVAILWEQFDKGHVEEVDLNRVTSTVDARGRFFKHARAINTEIIK